jgi:hypothetical protein
MLTVVVAVVAPLGRVLLVVLAVAVLSLFARSSPVRLRV